MIKTKLNIGVITSSLGTEDPAVAIKKAHVLGFKKVQLAWLDKYLGSFNENDNTNYRKAAEILQDFQKQYDVKINTLCASFEKNEESGWNKNVSHYINLANELGVSTISQHILPIAEKKEQILDYLAATVSYASQKNVMFAMETMTESLDEMIELSIQLPRLTFSFDPGNLLKNGMRNDEIFEAYTQLEERGNIGIVHLKDYDTKSRNYVPLGKGILRLGEFIALAKDHPLMIEQAGPPNERYDGLLISIANLKSTIKKLGYTSNLN